MEPKSLLIIVTSHGEINSEHSTGLWFEEFAVPYRMFHEQGYKITIASPQGGAVPIDPQSMPEDIHDPQVKHALSLLSHTDAIGMLAPEDYDAVFFPGGHGAMYDLPHNPYVADLVAQYLESDKIVAAVCHGPAALVGAKNASGQPVIKGRKVTAFSNEEESEVKLDKLMPFLLVSKLLECGAQVETASNWQSHVIIDKNLITGQNPQSSEGIAKALISAMA